MPQQNEYEFIAYQDTNFKLSVVRLDYFHPHFHRELEIGLLLYGNQAVLTEGTTLELSPGDFWIINAFCIHETIGHVPGKRAILLELQIRADFFSGYYPDLQNTVFGGTVWNRQNLGDGPYEELLHNFLALGLAYFKKEEYYQFATAGLINLVFRSLMENIPHSQVKAEEKSSRLLQAGRMKKLADYIALHYEEPLFLSDIAEKEGLSMSRLSHLFKEGFGMSFQEYLQKIRCEKAAQLLRTTDMKLLDVSIACGFSDPKYMNQALRKLYDTTPKNYRNHYRALRQKNGTTFTDTPDLTVPDDVAIAILEYCMEKMCKGQDHLSGKEENEEKE